MPAGDPYNGWANRPTWTVQMWLSNEEHLYNAARGVINNAGTPHQAADDLREWVNSMRPSIEKASMFSDLLTWALRVVDWDEIVQSLGPAEWEETEAAAS